MLTSRWLRVGVGLVTATFLVLAVIDQWHQVGPRLDRISAWTIVGGFLSSVAALLATMLSWRSLLSHLGPRVSVVAASRIYFTGQLGKYAPGSVWPVLIQMELASGLGVPRITAATASALQMAIAVVTGAIIAIATLPLGSGHFGAYLAWVPAVVVMSVIALHPRIANPVLNYGLRKMGQSPLDRPLSWGGLLAGAGWQVVSWLLFAVPVILVTSDVGGRGARILPLGVGTFALSWVAGFVFVLAPAGAGVREGVMIGLLSTIISPAGALTVAVVSRLMMTAGDLTVGGPALVAVAHHRRALRRRTEAVADVEQASDSG